MTYQYQYVQSGQSQTKDDVLDQLTKWDVGTNGQVKQGGSFGPGGSFPNGTIFENATLTNFIKFGDGCIFVNCNFKHYKKAPFSTFGNGCVFDNCSLNGVTIPKTAVLNKCKTGAANVQTSFINNKREEKPAGGAVVAKKPETQGTRITNWDGDITLQPGIHGPSSATVTTNKTEDLPPAV